jgi:Protein of unknown function (DUF3301)
MIELAAVALILGVAWLWYDSGRAREAAMDAARRACVAENVLLLDDTVALAVMRLRRRNDGRVALLRVYRFEFSDTGNNRLDGSIALLGHAVQTLFLAPHRFGPADMAP